MSETNELSVASAGSVADIIDRLLAAVKADAPIQRALVVSAAAEIERLRFAIRRIAEQDATLSVCEGEVTVTVDGTLTDAEREAVDEAADTSDVAAEFYSGKDHARADAAAKHAATLRGLLERMK
jgi:hypothetical protein